MPLDQAEIISIFKEIHLFQSFEDDSLQAAVPFIEQVEYHKDDVIFQEGDFADFFYIIARGQVRLVCQPNSRQPSGQLGILEDNDYFGEEVLETGWPRQITAQAENDLTLLQISRINFIQMLQVVESSTFEKALQLILDSYRMKLRKNFSWLNDRESIIFIARRHLIVLLRMLLMPTMVGMVILFLFLFLFGTFPNWFTLDALLFAVVGIVGWLIYAYVDWTNDYYVITTDRVLFQERVILVYDSRQESPLTALQSCTTNTSQWGRWLNYGNVAIRTLIGNILFQDISNPTQVMALVQQSQLRAQNTQRRLGIKDIKVYLSERIIKGPERTSLERPIKPAPIPSPLREFILTMFHLRYVKGNAIYFRTSFFILLEKTGLPLTILLGLIAIFLISLTNQFPILTLGATCSILGLFGMIVFGWLGYHYWDWHNDVYIITNDQIVDVNKKPLGHEERQAALIKNILSIEYKRKGIFALLFNFGTVYIRVGDIQLTFDDVLRPSEVQRELFHSLMRVKKEEQEKQAKDDKAKSGDWFDAFHQWNKEEGSSRPSPRRQGF